MKRNVLVELPIENILFYDVESLTNEQIVKWVENYCNEEVIDCYDIKSKEIEYFIIDNRIQITQERESLILKQIEL